MPQNEHRLNNEITAPEVRVIGEDIEPGIYPLAQALKWAQEKEVDLVEISPNAVPPVCRLIDYKKFLYEKKKKDKDKDEKERDKDKKKSKKEVKDKDKDKDKKKKGKFYHKIKE